MKHSLQAFHELERARQSIVLMLQSENLDDFDDHWKSFLHRLERVWSKSESHYGRSPKWSGWKGQFEKLRKSDPLLSYLRNARGAEEHTVAEIVSREAGSMKITAGPTGSVHIRRIVAGNGQLSIDADGPFQVTFVPERTKLEPVTNRGRLYEVPRSHLSKPIDPGNVAALAQLGVDFYADFLLSAEKFFVDHTSNANG